jgi:hypothetical protein
VDDSDREQIELKTQKQKNANAPVAREFDGGVCRTMAENHQDISVYSFGSMYSFKDRKQPYDEPS